VARRGAALAAALAARRAARERDSRSAAAFPRLAALSRSTRPPPLPAPAPRARPPPGLVVDEDFARRAPAFARLLSDVAPPALGLNGTGGAAAAAVLRALAPGADLVTYGCMSGQPVRAGADVFATKQQTLRGASLAAALAGLAKPARDAAVRAAVDDVAGGEAARVRLLLAREPFADFPAALARAARAGERKVVLVMA
jgi:NADPH:quinone reductase-like Zn-dependent oxidoreductase